MDNNKISAEFVNPLANGGDGTYLLLSVVKSRLGFRHFTETAANP